MEKIVTNVVDVADVANVADMAEITEVTTQTRTINLNEMKAIAKEQSLVISSKTQRSLQIIKYKTISFLYKFAKRVFDIMVGLVGSILLLPIMAVVKMANLIHKDNEPILFKQERIGKNGDPIYIYKIRSMVPNAEQVLDKLMKENPEIKAEYEKNKKLQKDPRITRVGAFIRKTSLDEFGQFVNILKGDMSVVGPRPYLIREKDDMGIYYGNIIQCKPGLTGLWQVEGRSDIGFENRCRLDKFYNEHKGMWFDIKIFFKTFISVLKGVGAR